MSFSRTTPGDVDGGLVDVGDLALGADGDERIQARFDQASDVLRRPLLRRHVANRGGDQKFVRGLERSQADLDRELRPIPM